VLSPLLAIAGARVGQALLTALLLASLCFAFVQALPGDAALRIAAARVGDERVTTEVADRIRREEGLDRPLLAQYAAWVGRVATGDLGRSLVSRKPVWEEIAYHGRFTLGLGALGWCLSYLIALPLGAACGFAPGGRLDRATNAVAVALASLPSFLVGIGLISVFALSLRWLPPAGSRTAAHMVLPALTLALGLAAFSVRIIRNAVVEVRAAFYMTFARIRGRTAGAAFRHHGVRNAAIPVATFAALQFAYMVDGFVVVETLFNYPGLGELLVKALIARDVPVIMGAGLVIGLIYAAVNLAADLACFGLDPRQRRRLAA
jgi:peptide/nickel transport system permease protein